MNRSVILDQRLNLEHQTHPCAPERNIAAVCIDVALIGSNAGLVATIDGTRDGGRHDGNLLAKMKVPNPLGERMRCRYSTFFYRPESGPAKENVR